MSIRKFRPLGQLPLASLTCFLLAACSGRSRPDTVTAPDVPTNFDMTVRADKDGQFDLDGATLDSETLKGALNYRKEQGKGVNTLLLIRGEKNKVTERHIAEIGRIHLELKLRTFVQEKEGGEIAEIKSAEK